MLTVTEALRERGVVGWFVEFFGEGLNGLPLADRATLANMSPEFGSTCAIFPVDAETIRYLELTGRGAGADRNRVEAYARAQGSVALEDSAPRSRLLTTTLDIDLDCGCAVHRGAKTAAGPHSAERIESLLRRARSEGARQGPCGRFRRTAQTGRRRGADRRHNKLHQHL